MAQLIIVWTCVGVFVATAVITLLALTKVIQLADKKYLDRLFAILIVQVVVACVALFAGWVEGPESVKKQIQEAERASVSRDLRGEIEKINRQLDARNQHITTLIARPELKDLSANIRADLNKPLRIDPNTLRMREFR